MVDMKYGDSGICCDDDWSYQIGFFLDAGKIDALGIKDGLQSGQEFMIVGKMKIKSTTEQDAGEKMEAYAFITDMGIVNDSKETPRDKIAKSYNKGESNDSNKDGNL